MPAAARAIEEAGYDGVVTMDNRHEPFLPLAVAAVNSESLELVTGIAVAFPRSPMVTAMTAWDLQAASRGRFVLGLGSQIKPHIERRFGTPWSAPGPRMREYIESLRAIWGTWERGEPLAYEGKHYRFSLMTPNFTPERLETPPPAITVAAVGPRMLATSADAADGARLHGFCTRRYLVDTILPLLEQRLAARNKPRSEFEITGGGFICTGPDDESVARVFEWVRQRVGFYGSTPSYWPVLEAHDLGDLGRKLNRMTKEGRWRDLADEVSDDVTHLFAAVGRYDQIKAAVEQRFGGLSDAISAGGGQLSELLPPDLVDDLKAVPTPFTGYRSTASTRSQSMR